MSDLDTAIGILSTATSESSSGSPEPPTPPEPSDAHTSNDPTDVAVDSPAQDGEGEGTGEGEGQLKVPSTAQIRASLKAFRDASPEHSQAAKLLNDGYSRYEAYKEVIPTVEEARTIRAQLDTVGGLEGIANMQSILSSVEETDSLLEAGDPKVLDQIIEDSPEGFKKLAPHYLNRLQKLDPDAFGGAVQPHFVRALNDAGFPAVVEHLLANLSDKPELQKVVASMKRWFDEQKSIADRAGQDTLQPERQKLNDEWAKINSERQKEMQSYVGGQVSAHIREELGAKLRPYAFSLNQLPVAMRQDVARAAIAGLAKALEADKAYQTQISAMMGAKKPDRDRIVAFNKSKVSNLADKVIAEVVKGYGLKPGTGPATKGRQGRDQNATKTPESTDVIKISSAPADKDIDWDFPRAQEAFIRHRAALTPSAAKARGLKSRFVQW